MNPSNGPPREDVGAYGLKVQGISDRMRAHLGSAGRAWPSILLKAGTSDSTAEDVTFTDERARVPIPGGGEIVVERSPLVGEVSLPSRPQDAELLHPYLGYVGVMAARWLGRDCVHGGAFVLDGGAWACVGQRGTGKSSLLGWLAGDGFDIVCDDVLIVREQSLFAGPRFVDLRADAAERLGGGEALGMVGARERWRVPLPPTRPELPLRGWIFLDWGAEAIVERVGPAETMMQIKEQLSLFTTPRDPVALLDLAALPAWRFSRTRDWQSMPTAVRTLLDTLGR